MLCLMLFRKAFCGSQGNRKPREDWILRGPRLSSFWLSQNLYNHVDRQARTGDIVLVKSREMTGRSQTLPWRLGGGGVKTIKNKIRWSRCGNLFFCNEIIIFVPQILWTVRCWTSFWTRWAAREDQLARHAHREPSRAEGPGTVHFGSTVNQGMAPQL